MTTSQRGSGSSRCSDNPTIGDETPHRWRYLKRGMRTRGALSARSRLTVAGLVAFVAISPSCSWIKVPPAGEIFVSRPEVFTRQRLVNRRLTEQQWLEDQLAKTPTETSFQGLRDLRVFTGIYSRTTAAFDPLAGQVAVAQNELTLQNLQNQRNLAALQHQLDMLKVQQQIDTLQKAGPQQTSGTTGSGGSSSTPPATPAAPGAANTTPTPSTVFSTPPALPSPADTQTTKAKLTSIEVLRDQLAWRNAVQAALREQELDDAHDLAGMALYTLKFDLSVLPHGSADGYAKVEFDLDPKQNGTSQAAKGSPGKQAGAGTAPTKDEKAQQCREVSEAYYSWFWHFRRDLWREAVALQQRLELDLLSEEERVRLAAASAAEALRVSRDEKKPEPATERVLRAFLRVLSQPVSERRAKPLDSIEQSKQGAAKLVESKYKVSFPDGLITFEEDLLPIDLGGRRYYVSNIPNPKLPEPCTEIPASGPVKVFAELEPRITKSSKVFVADPKEQAQNISEVAAIEQLRNMVLSLQATLPQIGLTAGNYTEYLKRSQERLQAIARRPLVVAYSHEGGKFGWILGPRFEITKDGKPQFHHTAAQHSVQVSVIVPAWKRSLRLPYTTSWVDQNGAQSDKKSGYIDLEFPGDDRAITTALLTRTGTVRAPILETQVIGQLERPTFRLQAGKPADILIRGQNLWRNPKVFVGGQPANLVTVLPDMNGLSAHFDNVAIPPRKSKETPLLDLVVVTSEGADTLRRAVQLLPEAVMPEEKFALTVESRLVINSRSEKTAPLLLSAPLEALPDGFYQVQARVRPLLRGEDGLKVTRSWLQLPATVELSRQGNKAVFQPFVELPNFSDWPESWRAALGNDAKSISGGVLMQAELLMAATPGAPLAAIPSADGKALTVPFFMDRRSSQGTLTAKGTPANDPRTTFGPSNNFGQAIFLGFGGDDLFVGIYPGIMAALQSSVTLRIAEMKDGTEIASTTTRFEQAEFDFDYFLDGKRLSDDATPLQRLMAKPTMVINSLPMRNEKDPRADAVKWLQERLGDGKEHSFKFSVVVPPNVQVPIEPLVKITAKK